MPTIGRAEKEAVAAVLRTRFLAEGRFVKTFEEAVTDRVGCLGAVATSTGTLEKRLNLANGTDSTGKVIVKGQSPGQSKTKTTKLTGKDLDAKMAEAIRAASDE